MTVRELRQKYLAFFQSKGHLLHASGSLVPILVTGELDESLLFNGAGMIQFKPYFRGVAEPPSKRLITCQKCLRTGDIDEVGDNSHLTFFEMLGNFSFGDYFKDQAIAYSWEFLTGAEWLKLDPKRLAFTVFTEDDDAFAAWSTHLEPAGINPQDRVFRLGEESNYWPAGSFSKGPPGPCGPNSEMFYWVKGDPPTGPYSVEDFLRDESEGKWLEIWNDVFISYEWQGVIKDPTRPEKVYTKTGMPDLPFKSIDTGMGLDRTAAVLAGFDSVYDTDSFQPLFRALETLGENRFAYGQSEAITRAMRIICDHLRAATFCIADGILPSNTGRGYVLRRLIRRAVLKAQRTLGFEEPLLARLAPTLIESFGDVYPELLTQRELILDRFLNEEDQFRRTLNEGFNTFQSILASLTEEEKASGLPGDKAFFLYDTFGFPLEVTVELAQEEGLATDIEGYREALAKAQEISRGAGSRDDVYGGIKAGDFSVPPTLFTGYKTASGEGVLLDFQRDGESIAFALDQSPFYAESGGQSADTGEVSGDGFVLQVTDVRKQNGVWVHKGQVVSGEPKSGVPVTSKVDEVRRKHILRGHTATHLLHAALRKVLGGHVTQQGSLVAPDSLRFDFSHGSAMSPQELQAVEKIVNEQVWGAQTVVTYEDLPIAEARAMGAMALFGEKYGDKVRLVQVGDMKPEEASFSRELCGGIHVKNTGEIGFLRILHEGSAASGVRRISAVTGEMAYEWLLDQQRMLAEAADKLRANPKDLLTAIDKTLESLKEEKRKREKLASSSSLPASLAQEMIGQIDLKYGDIGEADSADAQRRADAIVDPNPLSVAVLSATGGGKLLFVVKAGPEAVKAGIHAGNLARDVAKATGGGGGGRPNFATAGGRDLQLKDEALRLAPGLVKAMLGL